MPLAPSLILFARKVSTLWASELRIPGTTFRFAALLLGPEGSNHGNSNLNFRLLSEAEHERDCLPRVRSGKQSRTLASLELRKVAKSWRSTPYERVQPDVLLKLERSSSYRRAHFHPKGESEGCDRAHFCFAKLPERSSGNPRRGFRTLT